MFRGDPNPDLALDEEAGKLLQENYKSYCERAKLITSVHTTPKVPPPEFDTQSASADMQNAPAPITASLSSTFSIPSMSPPLLLSPQKGTMTTTTVTIPLQQSLSNTFSVSSSLSSLKNAMGEQEKGRRRVSPAPLGTADSNISPALNPSPMLSPAKAVKRGAAPGEGAGEKRKKALKRL